MAKSGAYAPVVAHPSHGKIKALVKGAGVVPNTSPIGKAHREIPGKGKVSTTQLKHGMNSRQSGC